MDIEEVMRRSAERRARGDFIEDPRETAKAEARKLLAKAREIEALGDRADPKWISAYATLAMAVLAVGNA